MKRFNVGDMAKVIYTGGYEDCYLGTVCEITALDVAAGVRMISHSPIGDIAIVRYPVFDYQIRMCDGATKHCCDECLAPINDPDAGTVEATDEELEHV
jgi:hypothetical protein